MKANTNLAKCLTKFVQACGLIIVGFIAPLMMVGSIEASELTTGSVEFQTLFESLRHLLFFILLIIGLSIKSKYEN